MNTIPVPQSELTVDEVLTKWPKTYSVFAALKTKCIGCFLQKFCTLRDVADTYHIPFAELTGELEKYIQKGVRNE